MEAVRWASAPSACHLLLPGTRVRLCHLCCSVAADRFSSRPAPHAPGRMLPAARHKHLTTTERVIACWFMVTGLIHFVIEGWVVAKADFYKDASGNYLSDTCGWPGRGEQGGQAAAEWQR